jgi:hypothetical protein
MTVGKMLKEMRRGSLLIESPFARALGKTAYITTRDIELLLKDRVLELTDLVWLEGQGPVQRVKTVIDFKSDVRRHTDIRRDAYEHFTC